MAFGEVGSVYNSKTSVLTITLTHGLTISAGNLMVALCHRDDAKDITLNAGGAAWTELVHADAPAPESAKYALHWKIAGATEPSSYTWDLNVSSGQEDDVSVLLKVFSSASDAILDGTYATDYNTSSVANMICGAADGQTINSGSVSIIMGMKDRDTTGATDWTGADNGYVSVIGDNLGRYTGMAHKIYSATETFSGDITLTPNGGASSDATYSLHVAFKESGGAPSISIPIAMYHRRQFNRG